MEEEYVFYTPDELYGPAIKYTRIDVHGRMWVGDYEYESQVNYCPMTGKKAPIQLEVIKTWESGAVDYGFKENPE